MNTRMTRQTLSVIRWLLPLGLCLVGFAGEWKSKGEVTVESRLFSDDDLEHTIDRGLGTFARFDTSYKNEGWGVRIRGFGRVDREDSDRDLTAIEEAWVGYKKSGWDARLGFQMLNWTATEAFHPADIINSRNLDSNIENADKLGELMFSIRRTIRDGGLTLYYMPYLEEPELPGSQSRLSFLSPDATYGETLWLTDGDEAATNSHETQWGFRFTQTIGDADLSFHHVDHLDRSQPLAVINRGFAGDTVTPVYFRVQNTGLTYLHIFGGMIFKLEAAHKNFVDHDGSVFQSNLIPGVINHQDHTQVAFGFEYGWSHLNGSETTTLLEGQSIEGVSKEERGSLSLFQRDLLVGVRHAFNDTMGRELLFTTIWDVERSHEYLVNLSYKQRLSDTWSIHVGGRYIDAPPKDIFPTGLEFLHESNQVYLNMSRYF